MSEWHLTDFTAVDVTVKREAHGGFGRVYMGPDRKFRQGQWRALKTLHLRYLATERGKRLFLNECLTWVGLWPHPNLLMAQSVTQINGQLFLVLEYAERGSLRDLLKSYPAIHGSQPLSLPVALALAQQIAAGLLALHTPDPVHLRSEPIIHRDLKPENILVNQAGFAMITDFGLAKVIAELDTTQDTGGVAAADEGTDNPQADDIHVASAAASRRYHTQRGVAMGSLPYMPPEQWSDAATAGPSADLYAFGLILGELFTGDHPLLSWQQSEYASEDQWRLTHFQGTPPSLAAARTQACHAAGATETEPPLPAELDTLFQRLLAKRPANRPEAAEALAVLQQMSAYLGEQPYIPPEYKPTSESAKWDNWSISCYHFGLHEEALARNDRALALAPAEGDVLLNRGNILERLGRLEEALGCYDRALANYPANDTLHQAIVWCQRASALTLAMRCAEAEVAYAHAVQLEPEDPGYWCNWAINERLWGMILRNAGESVTAEQHWRQGLGYAEQALHLAPNDPSSLKQRAVLRQLLNGGAFSLEG